MSVSLDDIRAARARIHGVAFTSPLRRSDWLSTAGSDVLLKLEVVQPTCSYKIRGAFNAAARLRESRADRPRLITASAGNHGRALARSAAALDLPLVVFIASGAPRAKVDAIRAAGAELRECSDYDAAERAAKEHAAGGHGLFVSPYSHPDVIAGAGTIGLELMEQEPALDAVVVPVGGGGLISGIAIAIKAISPRTRVIGVEVSASCPFTRSLAAGRLVTVDVGPSLADGLTGNLDPDTITLDIVRRAVDEIVLVDEPALRDALAGIVANEHVVVEGAGAAAVAAITSGRVPRHGRLAAILSGANIDLNALCSVLSAEC